MKRHAAPASWFPQVLSALLCAVILGLMLLGFAGCAKKSQAPPDSLSGAFSFNTGIVYGGKSYSAQVKKDADNVWTMKFTDPPALSGLEVKYKDGKAKVTYFGVDWEVPQGLLPDSGVTQGMLNSLEDIKDRTDAEVTEEDGKLVYRGESASGEYQIYVDSNSGIPVYAKLPGLGLEFSIEDFLEAS